MGFEVQTFPVLLTRTCTIPKGKARVVSSSESDAAAPEHSQGSKEVSVSSPQMAPAVLRGEETFRKPLYLVEGGQWAGWPRHQGSRHRGWF